LFGAGLAGLEDLHIANGHAARLAARRGLRVLCKRNEWSISEMRFSVRYEGKEVGIVSYLSLLRAVLGRVVWGGRRGGGLVGGVHRVGVVVVQVVRIGTGAGRRGGRRLLTPQKGVQVSKGGREYGARGGTAVGLEEGVLSLTTGGRQVEG
jgi:hypothetical protein